VPDKSPRLLVLQHIDCEPPGAYEDELREAGGDLVRVMLDQGEALPDWRDFDGIVVMGGPMGAYEDERLAWLSAEKRLIAAAVTAGAPFWGVCLGSQLLAASLGAAVGPGHEPEIGVLPVVTCADAGSDLVFAQAPATFSALQWHGDTFELPAGARRLARSDAYENQAFVVRRAYGVQFHIEIGGELGRLWGDVPAYAQSLEAMMGVGGLAGLLDEVEAHAAEMTALARRLFRAWLEKIVAPYCAQRDPVA
jgi:GMP synthase (glutamine-hydrolysing)